MIRVVSRRDHCDIFLAQVLPPNKDGILYMVATIRLFHGSNSTGPAFAVNLTQKLSSILMLDSYNFTTTGDLNAGSNSDLNKSLLAFNAEVFPIGNVLTITYLARIDRDREGNITDDIQLSYGSISQDGIGLQVRWLANTILFVSD